MHLYISQAVAAERVADAMRAADAGRRAREARQVDAVRTRRAHQPYRTRRAARRQPCPPGLTVSGQPSR